MGQPPLSQPPAYLPGRILVRFEPGSVPPAAISLQGLGGQLGLQGLTGDLRSFEPLVASLPAHQTPGALQRTYLLTFSADIDIPAAVQLISAQAGVQVAQPDYFYPLSPYQLSPGKLTAPSVSADQPQSLSMAPNDHWYPEQWGAKAVQSETAWDTFQGNQATWIAFVASGLDAGQTFDLQNKVAKGYDYVEQDDNPQDNLGFGTAIAGIAAAYGNNLVGMAGISWESRIMPLKACDRDLLGLGQDGCAGSLVVKAVNQAANQPEVGVIHLAFGDGAEPDEALKTSIEWAHGQGKVIVTGAGDRGTSHISYPAAFDHVIAVSGMSKFFEKYPSSNYGSYIDLIAPGDSLSLSLTSLACSLTDSCVENYLSSHIAAAFVAGAASLVYAALPELYRQPETIERLLEQSAMDISHNSDQGWDTESGWGLLDVHAALQGALNPPELQVLLHLAGDQIYHQDWPYTLRIRERSKGELLFEKDDIYLQVDGSSEVFKLYGIPSGEYFISLKRGNTLSRGFSQVNLQAGTYHSQDFGELRTMIGDYHPDDIVNHMDLLQFRNSYFPRVDSDWYIDNSGDGIVNYIDLLGFSQIYNHKGDDFVFQDIPSQVTLPGGAGLHILGGGEGASLELLPVTGSYGVGQEFDVQVILDTGGLTTSGANLTVRYDPCALQVVSTAWGSLLPDNNMVSIKPESGEIDIGSMDLQSVYNGRGTLITIRFRVLSGGTAAGLWVYFYAGKTVESNVSNIATGTDALGAVGSAMYTLYGEPFRVDFSGSLSPGTGGYLNSMQADLGLNLDQCSAGIADSVTFEAFYDGAWHPVGEDYSRYDGWATVLYTDPIADQSLTLRANIPTINGGFFQIVSNLVNLDRFAPGRSFIVAPSRMPLDGSIYLEWDAVDFASGVASFDLQVRQGLTGTWVDLLSRTPQTSTTYQADPSQVYSFRMRAWDYAGNPSDYDLVVVSPNTIYFPAILH
jgi:hypothetical protein